MRHCKGAEIFRTEFAGRSKVEILGGEPDKISNCQVGWSAMLVDLCGLTQLRFLDGVGCAETSSFAARQEGGGSIGRCGQCQWKTHIFAIQDFKGREARGCGHGGVDSELDGVEMLVPCLVSAVQTAAQGVNDGSNRALAEPVGLRMISTREPESGAAVFEQRAPELRQPL